MTIHFFTGCSFTVLELFLMFYLYAFLGWCCEVAFAAMKSGQFVNRGFLNSPICPIYGFGVTLVIILLYPFSNSLLLLLVGSIVITSLLEFLTGWILEQLFHTKWWDYSNEPFNLHGYICLRFSVLWGLACLGITQIFHPLLMRFIHLIPDVLGTGICICLTILTIVDLIATISAIRGLQKRLRGITTLAEDIHDVSDFIGKDIYDTVNTIMVNTEDERMRLESYMNLRADNLKEEKELAQIHRQQEQLLLSELLGDTIAAYSENMEEKRQKLQNKLHQSRPQQTRILRAFPNMQPKQDGHALETLRAALKKQKHD